MYFVLIAICTVGQKLKEPLIFFFFDFTLRPGPERLDEINCFSVDGDGEIDEV